MRFSEPRLPKKPQSREIIILPDERPIDIRTEVSAETEETLQRVIFKFFEQGERLTGVLPYTLDTYGLLFPDGNLVFNEQQKERFRGFMAIQKKDISSVSGRAQYIDNLATLLPFMPEMRKTYPDQSFLEKIKGKRDDGSWCVRQKEVHPWIDQLEQAANSAASLGSFRGRFISRSMRVISVIAPEQKPRLLPLANRLANSSVISDDLHIDQSTLLGATRQLLDLRLVFPDIQTTLRVDPDDLPRCRNELLRQLHKGPDLHPQYTNNLVTLLIGATGKNIRLDKNLKVRYELPRAINRQEMPEREML